MEADPFKWPVLPHSLFITPFAERQQSKPHRRTRNRPLGKARKLLPVFPDCHPSCVRRLAPCPLASRVPRLVRDGPHRCLVCLAGKEKNIPNSARKKSVGRRRFPAGGCQTFHPPPVPTANARSDAKDHPQMPGSSAFARRVDWAAFTPRTSRRPSTPRIRPSLRCTLFALNVGVVTRRAQRLERTTYELLPIAPVRFDVVDRVGLHQLTALAVTAAIGLGRKLGSPDLFPLRQRVPFAPRLCGTTALIVIPTPILFRPRTWRANGGRHRRHGGKLK